MQPERPQIPSDELNKPIGHDMPERKPLDLLPEREWLNAKISSVKYQIAMFNGQIQFITDMEGNQLLNADGDPVPRKEFEITFHLNDYQLSDGKARNAWLKIGASMGEKAHLPAFLYNVIGHADIKTPAQLIQALTAREVKLQLANKHSKKDPSKIYQVVIWDAVKGIGVHTPSTEVNPFAPDDLDPVEMDSENVPF